MRKLSDIKRSLRPSGLKRKLRGRRRKVLATALAILILTASLRLFLFLNPKEVKAATLSLSTTASTIQVDVPNRYRAVMTTDDTDDYILISDRAENDSSPDNVVKVFGSAINDTSTWYILRHDDARITTILESTASRVRIRVEGCYDTTAGGACIKDVAGGNDDVIQATEEYTFTTEGIFATTEIDFKGGLALASSDQVPSFSVGFNDINNNNIIAYSETVLYGDGETETSRSTSGSMDADDDNYYALQATGNYQDVIFGSMNLNGDKYLSNSSNGGNNYTVDDADEQDAIDLREEVTQTLSGKGISQFFIQFHAQNELNTEVEREAMFNDLTNPDYLSHTTGKRWDEQGGFFRDNFETGNFSEWDSTVTDGGDLSVTPNAGLAGTNYGMQVVIDDMTGIYIDKDYTAPASGDLRVRFYVDPNSITIPSDKEFVILTTPTGPSRPANVWTIFPVYLGYSSGGSYYLVFQPFEDDTSSQWHAVNITDSPHYVEIHVERGAGDGRYRWWIDGALQNTDSNQDNDGTYDALREFFFGANESLDAGTSGTIFLDELVVNDTGLPIGAATGYNTSEGTYTSDMSASTAEVDIDAGPNVSTLINDATDVEAGATSITVDSTTGFPSSGFAYIEGDKFSYTGTTGTTFTGIPSSGELSIIGHADNSVVALSQRHTPLYKLRNYRKNDVPQYVTLEKDTLTHGTEYNAAIKPFSTSYFAQDLLWHSTLEDTASVTSPDVGTGVGVTSATFTTGKYGSGLLIDASSEYASLDMPSNVGATTGTIEFWYKQQGTIDNFQAFFGSDEGDNQFQLQRETADTHIRFHFNNATNSIWDPTTIDIFDTTWHHVRVTYDTTANSTYLYLDGVSQGESTTDHAAVDLTGNDLRIGTNGTGGSPSKGIYDDFRIYDTVVGPDPIAKGGDTADSDEYLADPTNNYTLDFNDDDASNRGEYVWLGSDSPFAGVNMELATDGVGSSEDFDWEYWDGTSWSALSVTEQDTGASSFTGDGNFYFTPPGDWFPYSVNGSTDLYYIRGHLEGGSLTTDPVESQVQTDILLLHYQDKVVDENQTLKIPGVTSGANPPVVYWNLDEGYGTTANDSSGHGNAGTISGASWQTEDLCYSGKCLLFDGSNDEVTRVDDPEFDIDEAGSFTISAWVRHPDIATNPDVIVAKFESTGGDGGYRLQMEADGDISFGIDDENTAFPEDTVTSTTADYDDNQWHHISAVKDANDNLYLYIDGNLIDTDATISATDSLDNNDDFYLGIDGDGSSNAWAGFIDEFKFYRYARSADEIKADLVKGAGVRGASTAYGIRDYSYLSEGLVGYWKMDESSGTSVADDSGNANTGTLTNAQETGTATNDANTTDTVLRDDGGGSLSSTDDVYIDMILYITDDAGCGLSADEQRIISDYDGTNKDITVSNAFSADLDACDYTIRHQSSGKFGNGMHFDTGDDYISVSDNSTLSTGNVDWTATAWVNADTFSSQQSIVSKWGTNPEKEFDLYATAGDGRRFKITWANDDSANSTTVTADSLGQWQTNTWYFVAAYHYAAKGEVGISVNGGPFDTGTSTGGNDGPDSFLIGATSSGTPSVAEWSGQIDEVRIYKRVLSPSEISALYNWAPGPVGYWNFDEGSGTSTVYDRSGNGNNGTLQNMTELDWVPGKFGSALYFNGSNKAISLGNPTILQNLPDQSFTISAWVARDSSATSNDSLIFGKGNVFHAGLQGQSGTARWGAFADFDTTDARARSNTTVAADDQWHHYEAVYENNHYDIYIDGVRLSSLLFDDTGSTSYVGDASSTAYIGRRETFRYWHGIIDDIRIYNYDRSSSQIIEDMNAGHPVGGSPLPSQVGYWRFDEGYGDTAQDVSGNNNDGDLAGSGTTCPQSGVSACPTWSNSGKFGKALDFDGGSGEDQDDFVNTGSASSIDDIFDGGGAYTAWIYPQSVGEGSGGRIATKDSTTQGWQTFTFNASGGQAVLRFEYGFSSATGIWSTTNRDITYNAWNYVAVVYDADSDSNVPILYVNGIPRSITVTQAPSGTRGSDGPDSLYIGNTNSGGFTFDGLIDEFKLYGVSLTADQVKIDMNQGKAAVWGATSTNSSGVGTWDAANEYCPPRSSGTCIAPIAHWNLDEYSDGTSAVTRNDASGNGNALTDNANAPSVPGIYGWAGDFEVDTANQYLSISDNADVSFGDEDFTLSAWVNLESTSAGRQIAAKYDSSGANKREYSLQYNNTNDVFDFRVSSDGTSGTTTNVGADSLGSPSLNTWYYVVGWHDATANTVNIQVNDLTPDSASHSGGAFDSDTNFQIAASGVGNGEFDGQIDDVRLYEYVRSVSERAWEYNQGGPVGWWRLDECSGTTANDASGNSNNGTITIGGTGSNTSAGTCSSGTGTEAWNNGTTGKRNASLDFDGTDDYVTITGGDGSLFDFGGLDFVISAWVKTTTDGTVINMGGVGANSDFWALRISTAGKAIFEYENGSSTNPTATSSTSVDDNNWHHLIGLRDESRTAKIYVDGILEDSQTLGSGNTGVNTTSNVQIGEPLFTTSFFAGFTNLDGQIDEVKIFNYALTEQQIRDEYNSGAVRFGP